MSVHKICIRSSWAAAFAVALVSCSNDIKTVNLVSKKEVYADFFAKDVAYIYTDSARVVMKVLAPEVKKFSNNEKPYTEFPKGIRVVYYSTYPDTNSHIKANWAIRWTNDKMWEAKGNVVAKNTKGEVLNTEYLVWDEKKAIIYSDKLVKINSGKDVIIGEGFTADQAFNTWKILKVKGAISVQTKSDSTQNENVPAEN